MLLIDTDKEFTPYELLKEWGVYPAELARLNYAQYADFNSYRLDQGIYPAKGLAYIDQYDSPQGRAYWQEWENYLNQALCIIVNSQIVAVNQRNERSNIYYVLGKVRQRYRNCKIYMTLASETNLITEPFIMPEKPGRSEV